MEESFYCSDAGGHRSFAVITGMHRSHTSLLARLLSSGGLFIGKSLVGANDFNPYGHFEDVEFVQFHKDVLARQHRTWRVTFDRALEYTDDELLRARRLVEDRFNSCDGTWGFKVPHAVLFLSLWGLFPQSRFVFVVREPLEVMESLIKRTGRSFFYKPYVWLQYPRTYEIYNRRIASFLRANPGRGAVIDSNRLLGDPASVLRSVMKRLSIDLPREPDCSLVDRNVISRGASSLQAAMAGRLARLGGVQNAYRDLLALAQSDV